jgi:hypothetical protein
MAATHVAHPPTSSDMLGPLSSEALIVPTIQDDKVLDDSIVKTGQPHSRCRPDAGW